MKRSIFSTILSLSIVLLCLAGSYLKAQFLSAKDAEKKWGAKTFDITKFKNLTEKEKGAMATDVVKSQALVGKKMLDLRKTLGEPDSYFFSDTIYAYKITEPAENKEAWHLVIIPDEKLEKVKEIKIHKKCCYK